MVRTSVVDISGNFEEAIERFAIALGTAAVRRQVFNIIYGRGSKPKTAAEIAEKIGLSGPQAQVVQDALNHLASHHLISRRANEGEVKGGAKWLYSKDETVRINRARIVSLADNPSKRKKLSTKRRPQGTLANFTKVRSVRPKTRRKAVTKSIVTHKNRIALLVTNPDRYASLQTGVEARDIQKAIRASKHRDEIDIKAVLAPTFADIIDQLNEYRPTILHFSGHGGAKSLVLDNKEAGQDGGTVVDFEKVAQLLETIPEELDVLFLAACDTLDGAERFLSATKVAIVMADSVDDEGAAKFSEQFYRSLAGGATVQAAMTQAKLLLEHEGVPDGDLPTLLVQNEAHRNLTVR